MLISGVARTSAQKKRLPQKKIVRIKRQNSTNTFDNILGNEIEKLKQDEYTYYKCMECIDFQGKTFQKCNKCGRCGREFDEDGICENIQIYPSYW